VLCAGNADIVALWLSDGSPALPSPYAARCETVPEAPRTDILTTIATGEQPC
jgi:hypothetical protein